MRRRLGRRGGRRPATAVRGARRLGSRRAASTTTVRGARRRRRTSATTATAVRGARRRRRGTSATTVVAVATGATAPTARVAPMAGSGAGVVLATASARGRSTGRTGRRRSTRLRLVDGEEVRRHCTRGASQGDQGSLIHRDVDLRVQTRLLIAGVPVEDEDAVATGRHRLLAQPVRLGVVVGVDQHGDLGRLGVVGQRRQIDHAGVTRGGQCRTELRSQGLALLLPDRRVARDDLGQLLGVERTLRCGRTEDSTGVELPPVDHARACRSSDGHDVLKSLVDDVGRTSSERLAAGTLSGARQTSQVASHLLGRGAQLLELCHRGGTRDVTGGNRRSRRAGGCGRLGGGVSSTEEVSACGQRQRDDRHKGNQKRRRLTVSRVHGCSLSGCVVAVVGDDDDRDVSVSVFLVVRLGVGGNLDLLRLGRLVGRLSLLGEVPLLELVGHVPRREQRDTYRQNEERDDAHRAAQHTPVEVRHHGDARPDQQTEPDERDDHVASPMLTRIAEREPDERTHEAEGEQQHESGLQVETLRHRGRLDHRNEDVARDEQQQNHDEHLGPVELGHE